MPGNAMLYLTLKVQVARISKVKNMVGMIILQRRSVKWTINLRYLYLQQEKEPE